MTQKDKELLLVDFCARIKHKVRIKIGEHSDYTLIGVVITDEKPIKVEVIEKGISYKIEVSPDIVKPYLRPLSSKTKEEKKEYDATCPDWEETIETFDWYNTRHFDYRGLIKKGLALEAPAGMYKMGEQQ